MQALAATDPDVIATANPGCLIQIRAGAAARGLRARVVHPLLLLDEAYRGSGGSGSGDVGSGSGDVVKG
jgi:glycolate oxidase iron-sulfur subunit